jgi:y4mF family transcriptional regulator
MNKTELGKQIKQRRDLLRITQEQLSELSEVGIKTIYAIEQGKGNPSFEVLNKVLDILGMEFEITIKRGSN